MESYRTAQKKIESLDFILESHDWKLDRTRISGRENRVSRFAFRVSRNQHFWIFIPKISRKRLFSEEKKQPPFAHSLAESKPQFLTLKLGSADVLFSLPRNWTIPSKNHYNTTLEEIEAGTRAVWPKLSVLDCKSDILPSGIFLKLHMDAYLRLTSNLISDLQFRKLNCQVKSNRKQKLVTNNSSQTVYSWDENT